MSSLSHLRCLCHAIHLPAAFLTQGTLPIPSEIRHCDSRRYTSGVLCPAYLPLTTAPPAEILADRTRYLRPDGKVEQYFCTRCGTRTFDCSGSRREWFACSGPLEPVGVGDVVRIISHDFVGDAIDGGMAGVLRSVGERKIPRYLAGRDGPAMTDAELNNLTTITVKKVREENLFVACRCQSIKFFVLPPEAAGESLKDPKVARWLLDDGKKYLALNCACNYCRRAVGFSFASNAYIMPENIVTFGNSSKSLFDYSSTKDSTPNFEKSTKSLSEMLPGLRFDFSSAETRRSSCGTCGASVFRKGQQATMCQYLGGHTESRVRGVGQRLD